MAKTNKQVIDAFLDKKEAENHGLKSTGTALWSYGWWEMARWDGPVYVRKGGNYSMTTAHHRSALMSAICRRGFSYVLPVKETPTHNGYMEV